MTQTVPKLTRQALEEHQQLSFYLDQLERSLATLDDAAADVETMRRMSARVEGLRERLIEHFASEEVDGLFRALGEAVPQVRGAILELAGQHAQILTLLEMSRIRAQYGGGDEAQDLRRDLVAFLRVVREHEAQEEALLARAVQHDPLA